MMDSELTSVFEPAEEGGYTAFIAEVPGAISEGETLEEARAMVLDALHELTTYRREVALKSKGPKALIERIAPAFKSPLGFSTPRSWQIRLAVFRLTSW